MPALLQSGAAQHEIFAAVLDALRGAPYVLIVEDLHWGDEATLDLVRFLARRIATLPLLLVLSYRDAVAVDHPLRTVLGDLVSAPDARRLQLAPLTRSAVARARLEGHDIDADDVHRRTAGNPFFVSQIVAQPDAPLPDSVRDAVVARITALTPRCAANWSCCRAPRNRPRGLLAALGVAPAAVDALVATGLVDRHAHGVAFRHEIARSAVLGAVTPGSEPALHETMIAALEGDRGRRQRAHPPRRRGRRPATHPAVRGRRRGRGGPLRFPPRGRRVLRARPALPGRRPGDARGAAGGTVRRSSTSPTGCPTRSRCGCRRSRCAGSWPTSWRSARHTGRSRTTTGTRPISRRPQRQDEASHAILDGAGDDRELGYALANRSFLAAQRDDRTEAIGCGSRAQRIADELDDVALHGTAAIGIAISRLAGGDVHGREQLIAAGRVGLRQGIDELATAPMSHLAHLDVEQGRLAEADAVLVDALRLSEERDIPICSTWQRGVRARLRLLTGRWTDAERDAQAVLAAGNLPLSLLWPHLVLGLLAARRDAPPDNPHLDELWRIALRVDVPDKLAAAAAALAENAWITRRPDPRLADARIPQLVAWSAAREHASGSLGRWAHRLAAAGVQDLEPGAAPPIPPQGEPYEHALALVDGATTDGLLAAVAVLDELGARAVAALVRAQLRERGVSGGAPRAVGGDAGNPAGLTARQLDVLALLVDGLSNADIAARLVISRKTADHHVSAILAKLAVRSRGEAVAAARRLGVSALSMTRAWSGVRRRGPELGGHRDDEVRRKPAAPGVLAHGVGVVGLVQAVDLVARHVAAVPGVGHAQAVDDLVGRGGDLLELLGRELPGAGNGALDEEGGHGRFSVLCVGVRCRADNENGRNTGGSGASGKPPI